MKKLFLAVALVAASMTASATVICDFATAPAGFTSGGGAEFVDLGAAGVSTLSADASALNESTFSSYPGMAFVYKNSGGTGKIGFKFDPTTGNCQADGGDVTIVVKSCQASTLYVKFSAKSTTAVAASEMILGKGTSSLETAYPANMTIATDVTSSATDEILVAEFAVTSLGNDVAFKAKSGYRIYQISDSPITSSKDAISSDLLKLKGEVLENTSNLSVEIYSITGVKVLTSSETAINVSGLSGAFVAKTAEGTLKFVK